ncbi:MAG: Methylated-DNA--protein-cysteine methyltransferase [Chlamydiae bacterium]|nr:Methylated-DNA--protein-cysteine methyltransferase [Chlamydiota bacterium]
MSMEFLFEQGPRVLVTVKILNGAMDNVDLSPQKSFTLRCNEKCQFVYDWCEAYSHRLPTGELHLDWRSLTRFQTGVLQALTEIPFGETRTYKSIAERCGSPNGYRAVGGACGINPFPLFVPCHRVLASDGKIGGFSQGLELKHELLEFEQG